jgi:hypothetical protein
MGTTHQGVIVINVSIGITGTTKLLMHADTLADPLDPKTKEFKRVSGKRTKTDADHEEMARLEYLAGLYLGTFEGKNGVVMVVPAIPYRNVMKCLIEGARITKSGPKIERGLTMTGAEFPLIYDGPTTPEKLYADKNFVSRMSVKVGQARTMRCRPAFTSWALIAEAMIDPEVLSAEELQDIATNAGRFIGLGDYRKGGGFGRFTAEVQAA